MTRFGQRQLGAARGQRSGTDRAALALTRAARPQMARFRFFIVFPAVISGTDGIFTDFLLGFGVDESRSNLDVVTFFLRMSSFFVCQKMNIYQSQLEDFLRFFIIFVET